MCHLDCLSVLLTGLLVAVPASFSLVLTQQLERSFKNGIQIMLLLCSNPLVLSDSLRDLAPTTYLALSPRTPPPQHRVHVCLFTSQAYPAQSCLRALLVPPPGTFFP